MESKERITSAIDAVQTLIQSYENYQGGNIHPVLAAQQLDTLHIELSEEEGAQFLQMWQEKAETNG